MTKTSKQLKVVALITIALIVLKAFNLLSWSWWWILVPVWLPVFAGLISLAFYYIIKYRVKPIRSKWLIKWYMAMYIIFQEAKRI